MSTLADRYRALPRAVRWAVIAGLAFVGYFVVVEPILEKRAAFEVKADEKAKQLAAARSGTGDAEVAETDLKTGVTRFGLPQLPGPPAERADALTRCIATVLQTHGVRDHTSTVKETPLSSGALSSAFGADYRVDRLITELQFDASPEVFMGVLADLERSPEVAAVSRVQLRKSTPAPGAKSSSSRLVRASIAVEAWELVRKGKTR